VRATSAGWLANFKILIDSMNFNILETLPSELQILLFDDIFEAHIPKNVMLVS